MKIHEKDLLICAEFIETVRMNFTRSKINIDTNSNILRVKVIDLNFSLVTNFYNNGKFGYIFNGENTSSSTEVDIKSDSHNFYKLFKLLRESYGSVIR